MDTNFAISGPTGNMIVQFKNGDTMMIRNYPITNVLKK